jgi:hypothetical protein
LLPACATALQMLPNVKFLICGILFCVLLFAAAGAGVTLPESRTHIGEMPEVGRPMLQQSMAEAPPRTRVYMMMVSRGGDEPQRLRGETADGMAATTQPRPDLPPPDILKDVPNGLAKPGAVVAAEPPASPPPVQREADAATGTALRRGAQSNGDDRPNEAAPPEVATLAPAAAEDGATPAPFVNVPLPPPRRTMLNGRRHGQRMPYRGYSIVQHHITAEATDGQSPAAAR